MPFHNPAFVQPSQQEIFAAKDESLDPARDVLGWMLQFGIAAGPQGVETVTAFGTKSVKIGFRPNIRPPGGAEESGEAVGESIDVGALPAASSETVVQHAPSRQANHLDQPVDDDPRARDRQIAPRLKG